ncbi:MAG: hypothetical protein APF81_26320 [Desulfosporosinus sp. BRH_c37]|nr:MAG: hypothetical protein APF81_26320 [Desulfosporosinus sp. BRH_c37]
MKCDIVIVGAGPAGLWAAKTAADEGFDVVVLEEHPAVGLPKHCSGWLLGCEFTDMFFAEIKDALPYQKVTRLKLIDPLSGQVMEDIEDSGWGGYLARRELIDRELAKVAIMAGAKLFLNVKAEALIKEDGIVVGVKTASKSLPEVRAKVTICADGMKSAASGFARKEIATEAESETYTGIQLELVNVKEVTPGQIEIYEAEDPKLSGRSLWPHGGGITLASFSSMDAYNEIRSRRDNLFSQKIASSYSVYLGGFPNRKEMGFHYHNMVKDGVIFVGEASGASGIVHGMITGSYATKVAKKAIEQEDLKCIYEYESLVRKSDVYQNPFSYRIVKKHYGSYRTWLERSKEIKQ